MVVFFCKLKCHGITFQLFFLKFLISYQLHKMVRHTLTIHRQQLMNCFIVFDYFLGLALKGAISQ